MVLSAHLRAVLSVEQQDCGVCHVEGGDGCAYEIVRTRTVDDVQFLVVVFHMIYCGEHAVAVILLYGEIVADCGALAYTTATLDDACLVEQGFSECCLS